MQEINSTPSDEYAHVEQLIEYSRWLAAALLCGYQTDDA